MAYLDDSSRANGWIVTLTIPAVAFFVVRALRQAGTVANSGVLDELAHYVNAVIWISPIFVLIQIAKMSSGTAARSWQNILCTLVTAAAAFTLWRTAGLKFVG